MRKLDPDKIYQRAMPGPAALDELEQLVFAVKDMEVRVSMDGWAGFFIDSHYAYEPARTALETVGDGASLGVIEDFVAYLAGRGVTFAENPIRDFYYGREQSYSASIDNDMASEDPFEEPNWEERFNAVAEERWRKIDSYLWCFGARLST